MHLVGAAMSWDGWDGKEEGGKRWHVGVSGKKWRVGAELREG